jgi:LPXTG-motif cell wall-anchored protein
MGRKLLTLTANGLFLAAGLLGAPAFAKTFKTAFIRFELPPNWSCQTEEIDWVCQPDNPAERSEAIIIVVTKQVNPIDDTLPKYEGVLKTPRNMRDLLGNSYKSEVKFARVRQIKGQPWADALHLGSEIPKFYTRYLASTKEDKVAGLVSYSIAESVYPKWGPVLDGMIETLEIFFDPNAFNELLKAGPGSLLGSRGGSMKRFAPKDEADKKSQDGGSGMDPAQLAGIALIVGAVGYVVWKKRKKG